MQDIRAQTLGVEHLRKVIKYPIGVFGKCVANLLGVVFGGLHRVSTDALRGTDWESDDYIKVWVTQPMGTHEFAQLTKLTLLAHEMGIKVEVAPGVMRLSHMETPTPVLHLSFYLAPEHGTVHSIRSRLRNDYDVVPAMK